jgi:hypothetical protein
MKEITWKYCETCDCAAAICPKCGNNACNGAYGLDGKCDVCPDVYRYQQRAYDRNKVPSKEQLEKMKKISFD